MPDLSFTYQTDSALPEPLRSAYRCLSCLKSSPHRATYLCEQQETGQRVIVKLQDIAESDGQLANEDALLRKVAAAQHRHSGLFPLLVAFGQCGEQEYLIRSYIPGESVENYVESGLQSPGASRQWAVQCVTAVLEQLTFLHRLQPPVIHRDIKPQNVIAGRDGQFHLIDFGIARSLKPDSPYDTQIMGTGLTAPPEQFGYRQTDERSDIYAAGVLLRYCLTQEYGQDADAQIEPSLRRIVERATRFDPDQRYQRAGEMLDDLKRAAEPTKKHRRLGFAAALLALILITGVIILSPGRSGSYRFREPLIEQAVRLALDIPEGDLTRADLARMTALHIFGRQIYADDRQFFFIGQFTLPYDDSIRAAGLWEQNGGIRSLEDIAAMPNLRELSLYRQEITDISPLKNSRITRLGIGLNPVRDLTALMGQKTLTALNLTCLPIDDAAPIASVPNLTALCIGGTDITALRPLSHLPLRELNLVDLDIRDGACLDRFTGLGTLTVSKLYPGLLSQLSSLPLTSLTVTHAQDGISLQDLEVFPLLEQLSFSPDETGDVPGTPLRFPKMRALEIKNVRLESLRCLSAMPGLQTLSIREADCAGFDGLEALDALETIYCTEEQAGVLSAMYPGIALITP